eukprot:397619-Amphidinium_carterae.1
MLNALLLGACTADRSCFSAFMSFVVASALDTCIPPKAFYSPLTSPKGLPRTGTVGNHHASC